jgi:hypothetical protein
VARIAVDAVRQAVAAHDDASGPDSGAIELVRFVLFSPSALAEFESALAG